MDNQDKLLTLIQKTLSESFNLSNVPSPRFELIRIATGAMYQQFRAFWVLDMDEERPDHAKIRNAIYATLRLVYTRSCHGMFVHEPRKYKLWSRAGLYPVNGSTLYTVAFDVWDDTAERIPPKAREELIADITHRLEQAGVRIE